MRTLDAGTFDCCVTSPPYWGLRDYGHDGQIGLEPSPLEYVAALVGVFREVRRVIRDDGTLWLNIGDSYNNFRTQMGPGQAVHGRDKLNGKPPPLSKCRGWRGLKEKDLVGIPWRLAFALQDDGWYLRSDIVWAKPNPMPERVADRPTRSHEYVFLLSKSERYFYDAAAIAEPAIGDGGNRNARSVWTIMARSIREAHFATMPPALALRCILAGSRRGGAVLDPFLGSGTVGMVAESNGRRWLGCDLSYAELSADRTRQCGLFGVSP